MFYVPQEQLVLHFRSKMEEPAMEGSDRKPTSEMEKHPKATVGSKRSFDVAFLTGSDSATRATTTTGTTPVESSVLSEEVGEHKSAFSRYVKRFVR